MTLGVLQQMFTCDKEGQHEWECSTRNASLKWCPSVKFMGDNLDDEILMLRWCNKNHGWKSDFHFQPEFRVCSETRFIGKGMSFNNSGHIDVVHWLGRARGATALLQWAGLWWRHVVRIKAMKLLRQSKTQVHDILPKCKGRKNTSY